MLSRIAPPRRTLTRTIAAICVALALIVPAAAFAAPAVTVRVEGAQRTLFSGTVLAAPATLTDADGGTHAEGSNPMVALDAAARLGAFPYSLTDAGWGLYVASVNAELPVATPPYPGWLFRVNGALPDVGADQITLKTGDDVLWYYGTYDASPTVAIVPSSAIIAGSSARFEAEQVDTAGVATPLEGATVYFGSHSAVSGADGWVTFPATTPGVYGVRVEKAGCIRSALQTVQVFDSADQPIYRFRNLKTGAYLWTASEAEKATIISALSKTWAYEGVAYWIDTANALNSSPLWRFVNIKAGHYLYTADASEKTSILATLSKTWRYEGPAFQVSTDPSGAPVWRFRNLKNGTYFYTADAGEKDSIVLKLKTTWQLEGPAYYLAP